MRLLFVRHGDPDYKNDCLNEIGVREARALAALGPQIGWGTCFVSPLGMRDTDSNTRGADASGAGLLKTLDWLQEFPAQVDPGAAELLQDAFYFKKNADGSPKNRVVWDMYPAYYHEHPAYSDYNEWRTTPVALHSDAVSVYDRIIRSFDEFLAERGYVREGRHYRVERENTETITFFCHFGVSCVLLSRLWNVSPFVPLQSLCMPTSSVTELYTEERQKGIAHFRTTRIGDTTHLTMAGLKPERLPHSALFAEVYSDFSQRHD